MTVVRPPPILCECGEVATDLFATSRSSGAFVCADCLAKCERLRDAFEFDRARREAGVPCIHRARGPCSLCVGASGKG